MRLGLRYREQLRGVGAFLLDELDSLVSRIRRSWEIEHTSDGAHKSITAYSLTLRRDPHEDGASGVVDADGTEQHTLGGPVIIDGVIEAGANISGGPGTGARGPGISIDGTDYQSTKWAVLVSDDAYADSLGVYDVTAGRELLKLYRGVGSVYTLSPSEDGITTVNLGDHLDSDLEFDEIAGKNIYARTAIYERTRTTPAGEWIDVAFNAADYTGSGTLVWTVQSGDITALAYTLVGKTMTVAFSIDTSSVIGTGMTLIIPIPGGFTSARTVEVAIHILDNLVRTTGYAFVSAGTTTISFRRTNEANFAASADGTYIRGEIAFPIS